MMMSGAERLELAEVGADLAVAVGFALVPAGAEVAEPGAGVVHPEVLHVRWRLCRELGEIPQSVGKVHHVGAGRHLVLSAND